ncbi:MAG: response regulator transcription factor [Ignavibacteriae bacterium]|nr:response regulator transcription factor [Ignavibacteriota bacterium]
MFPETTASTRSPKESTTAVSHKVLIIEDDRDIARLVEMHITDLGCKCEVAHDGESGLDKAIKNRYDLIVLDLMLPGLDGLEICKELRSEKNYTPILMLTSRSEEFDKVLGLEFGADDYLTKPFSVRELLARVKAIFRRVEAVKDEVAGAARKQVHFRDLKIDVEKRTVAIKGNNVELTAKEFDLLALFTKNPGKAYSRQALLDTVWGYKFDGYDHTVNSHINRLRAKIEDDSANPRYILTVWGVGYKFAEEE